MSMAASASSSSPSFCGVDPSLCKYDVFISFRGDDTRHNFTSHLYKALCQNRIRAYIDEDRLEKGDDVSRALPKAIEESAISIIIFSTNYASSTWCLDELLQILKCQKEKDQIILPIFYGVDPSHIRKQEKSYADAFVELEQRFCDTIDKVHEWRRALKEASGLCGWDSRGKYESDIVETVVNDVEKKLKYIRSNGRIKDLLSSLKTELRSANMALKDAEEKQLTDEDVRKWLLNMKEVIYRTDELRDKINYEKLRYKMEGASQSSTSFATSVEDEVAEILLKLEELTAQKDKLGLKEPSLRSHGPPLAVESEICGREDDKEAIIKLVVSDESCGDKIPVVLPIVGMGGIGKTTLAQLVFNDQRVENHFQIKVWVRVSTESDVLNITKQIFKRVTSTESSNEELFLLQLDLKKALKRKKFLFVLDDVWNEDCFWDELRRPFTSGASGSKIIITTRSNDVASMVNNNCNKHCYNLGGLKDSLCWEFFFRHAFENEDLNDHPDLCKIGEEIVRKCEGLPVAVKSVAALLGPIPSPKKWRKILDNKIWESKLQETTRKKILPALWLSYSYLSPELKRCFAYCSIFPKDHEFRKGEVILLWMAEGLLQSKGGATMEDVGEEYFNILTSRSFFQPVKSKSSFIMHGCMHDLATFVLGEFGFRLEENNLQNLPKEARHLFIVKKYICDLKQFEGLFKAKFLRTFLALEFNQSSLHMVPLQELVRKEGWLRVVSLPRCLSITEVPASVGNLKYLRYLDLSCTAISEIPSTICSLYNLETLLLKSCRKLTRLPADIGRLLKLRHLDFHGSEIEEFAPQICNLTELQTLTRFIACKEDGGSRIKELGDLQHLRGKFDISRLENVVEVENVSKAKLREKKFLTRLGLNWDGDSASSSDPEKHRQVLDRLQPHTNLKTLYISGYNGKNFSDWMGNQFFRNIVRVKLVKCGNCNSLSPIEQLPSLKELCISQWLVVTLSLDFNSNGSSMTEPFKHLEALHFSDMLNWTEWLFTDGAVFPCLKQLRFDECPKLEVRLPDCFPALTMLAVNCCRKLMPLLSPVNCFGFSSLEELEIVECPEQKDFKNGELPSSLKTLLLKSCRKLTRLPADIGCLLNLRHLDFAGSPINELPPRICELKDLQTLTRFIVCKAHSSIEELGDLQQLRGEFEICGLENVVDVENVYEAKLREKKFLTSLGLYWDGESCDGTSEAREILEALHPHQNLKALRIYGFAGERFPDWMGDKSFGNIVEVQLSECKNCKSLQPLGQLPSLKNLQISGFKSVKTIGPEFYSDGSSTTKPFGSLEVLHFEEMEKWEEWLFTKDQVFPSLKELVFYECPELDVWLPDCFPSLTKLLVSHCRELMPLLNPTSHQRNKFSSLEELEIFACPEQVIFLQGGLPSSLKKIRISRCRRLELLHYNNFQHLTSLKSLEIIECKELHRLPEELPTHPFELSIVECPFLESGGCPLI